MDKRILIAKTVLQPLLVLNKCSLGKQSLNSNHGSLWCPVNILTSAFGGVWISYVLLSFQQWRMVLIRQ